MRILMSTELHMHGELDITYGLLKSSYVPGFHLGIFDTCTCDHSHNNDVRLS